MTRWQGLVLRDASQGARQAVYFLKPRDRALVKIGHGSPVITRIKNVQCGSPEVLDALLIVKGGGKLERAIHSLLAGGAYRGEWYHHSPEVDILIYLLAKSVDPLSMVKRLINLTDAAFLANLERRRAAAHALVEAGVWPMHRPSDNIIATVVPLSSAGDAA